MSSKCSRLSNCQDSFEQEVIFESSQNAHFQEVNHTQQENGLNNTLSR